MAIAVISANVSCDSAENLAKSLKARFYNLQNSNKRNFTEFTHVFKYGFSQKIQANSVFNTKAATERAIDKLKTLALFKDDNITIEYTLNKNTAIQWIEQGHIVVARNTATGANGEGLNYCETMEQLRLAPAKFWTKYIHHTNELRVNVWRGKVVSIYDKIQLEDGNFKFSLWQGQEDHPQLTSITKKVWQKMKIDWCGIDIIRDNEGKLYILEVNSAPVLYPFTIKKLTNLIQGVVKNEEG